MSFERTKLQASGYEARSLSSSTQNLAEDWMLFASWFVPVSIEQ